MKSRANSMRGNAKSNPSARGGSLFAGILLGIILGLIAAGVVAWYILKNGSASFDDKSSHSAAKPMLEAKPIPILGAKPITPALSAVASSVPPASGVLQAKKEYEFYRVLTDKPEAVSARTKPPVLVKETRPAAAAPDHALYFIQAGSFPNKEEAEKLKAKLSLLGMEVTVFAVSIPDKGTFHRVRVGPFKGSIEMNSALTLLIQNGISQATPVKAQ